MPLCRKGDGYFIGIYSKKLDRRTIIALNAQHMNSLLSDRMAQLFLTYDVSTLGGSEGMQMAMSGRISFGRVFWLF